MLTVTMLVLLAAFITTIAAAAGKVPLWIAVFLVTVLELLERLPR